MLTFRNGEFYYTGILTFDYFHLRSLNLPFGNIKGEDFFSYRKRKIFREDSTRKAHRGRGSRISGFGLSGGVGVCFWNWERRGWVALS